MSQDNTIVRFAPSPNGLLHLGHAYSALQAYEFASTHDGRFLLRLEDIDVGRTRTAYIDAIFEDLDWLGLSWETPVLRQSERFESYKLAAQKLQDMNLLYRCYATRQEIRTFSENAPLGHDPDGAPLISRKAPILSDVEIADRQKTSQPYSVRLDMDKALQEVSKNLKSEALTYRAIGDNGQVITKKATPEIWGDVVLVRKDVPTSYHLSVVVDDAFQGVSHVTRGRDLERATDLHRLLQVLLGLPEPDYVHQALILGPDQRKLSKTDGGLSLRVLRAQGVKPADIRGHLEGILAPLQMSLS